MNTRNLVICFLLVGALGRAVADNAPPQFEEVYQLLRSNLNGASQTNLDSAAVKGLLAQFPGQAMLVPADSGKAASSADLLGKTTVYNDSFAYICIGKVEDKLAEKLRGAYEEILRTNKPKIKGIILDLRFAGGSDYAAAAAAADCFLNADQPLLDWGTGSARATHKSNAITVPVAILVNSETTGAAEALAAALRESNIGLILGGTTAGKANIFKDFPLAGGEKLRIATAPIKLGDGTTLAHGLKPDIMLETSLADEKAYMEDPLYKTLHPAALAQNTPATNSNVSNQNHRPTNEAELVRERRAGQADDDDSDVEDQNVPEEPTPPVITDAALGRALDLLKGIAVLQESHPG